MVKEAREIVRRGELGKILKVVTEYPQGWLLNPLEAKGQEQVWRNDPGKAGATGCLGDIGTHVEHLARYVTGFPKIVIFPTSKMALLEWPSLKQQSKAQQTEARRRR